MKHGPEPSFRERMGKFARRHPALCGTTSMALISVVLVALLGTAVVKIYGVLQDVHARLRVRQFDHSFTEIQFLLNTASGSDEHLKRGLRMANQEIGSIKAETGSKLGSAGWPRRLTATEQKRLREQMVEMIMLEARARVTLAKRHGSETDRRDAIRARHRPVGRCRGNRPDCPFRLCTRSVRGILQPSAWPSSPPPTATGPPPANRQPATT